jgi:polyisoprenoid-binding protein YceI
MLWGGPPLGAPVPSARRADERKFISRSTAVHLAALQCVMFLRLGLLLFAATLSGTPLLAAEHPLALDPAQSRLDVAVKASLHSFTAQLATYEATVALDDQGRVTAARLTFPFRALSTGKSERDKAMHTWQQTDTFPEGQFVLTTLQPAATGDAFNATGQLTLHGITRELRFPVTIARQGENYLIDGDAPIDTRNHGLPVIRMFGVLKVDPVVHVRFHLQGRQTS